MGTHSANSFPTLVNHGYRLDQCRHLAMSPISLVDGIDGILLYCCNSPVLYSCSKLCRQGRNLESQNSMAQGEVCLRKQCMHHEMYELHGRMFAMVQVRWLGHTHNHQARCRNRN